MDVVRCGQQAHAKGNESSWIVGVISAHHTDPLFQESLADYALYCEGNVPLLFTENENNNQKLFGTSNASPYVKDAFHTLAAAGKK